MLVQDGLDRALLTIGDDTSPFSRGPLVHVHRSRMFSIMYDPTACQSTTGEKITKQTFFANIEGLRGGGRRDHELFLAWSRDYVELRDHQTQYEYGSLATLRSEDTPTAYVVMAVVCNPLSNNGPTALLCLKDDIEKTSRDDPVRALVSIRKLFLKITSCEPLTTANNC